MATVLEHREGELEHDPARAEARPDALPKPHAPERRCRPAVARVAPEGASARQLSDDGGATSGDPRSGPAADAATSAFSADSVRRQRTTSTEDQMITVSGLTKQYGDRTVVDDVSLHPGARHGDRLPRPERRRQDDDDADDHRPGAGDRRVRRWSTGGPTPTLPNPGAVMGTLLDAGAVHPGPDRADPPAAAGRRARRARPRGSTRCSSWSGSPTPAGRRIGGYSLGMRQRLGHRRRAAGRPAGADVRRAGQRAGPGGHPLDARAAPRPRGPRRHGAAVRAPARRGRAHGRPAAGDRRRPDRRRRPVAALLGRDGVSVRAADDGALAG